MKKIVWQSKTHLVSDSFRDRHLSASANGGNAYDFYSALALRSEFDVQMSEVSLFQAGESTLSYWRRMRKDAPEADAVICEPYPIVFGKRIRGVKYAGMIHHIDDVLGKSTVKHAWYFSRLKRRLQHLDLVVTVSKYWKEYLENLGCGNVKVIYNSFDPEQYRISNEQVEAFKKKYSLPDNKPLIYIGNASRQKGAYEVYDALKNANYHLIMSGPQNHAPDLPVQYMKMDHAEYLTLLKASSVVITFSRMIEGWNRIAHEAMLCGTPVIGSGVGGMRELLEGGGQQIIPDASGLPDAVSKAIISREELAKKGHAFVSNYNMKYFNSSWLNAMNELLNTK
ncbi:MAG TPA: glycosyltransferase family 4 protein [Bacteroidia bacterium]|nr:glycosyltransferase family 4 protein [Bacteroidia bacterium]